MNDGRNFPFVNLVSRRNLADTSYSDLIEYLPLSAVLIDGRSKRIEAANSRFCTLTAVAARDLIGRDLDTLLPGWQNGTAPLWLETLHPADGDTQSTSNEAVRTKSKSGSAFLQADTIPLAKVTSLPLLPKGKQVLMIETPGQQTQARLPADQYLQFWKRLARLVEALQETGIQAAIEAALEAAHQLTGADTTAVYQIQVEHPTLRRSFSHGGGQSLPEEIDATEMAQLIRGRTWDAGKRPLHILHRQARAAHLSYLVTAPLGTNHAQVGLVALGGLKQPTVGLDQFTDFSPGEALLPVVDLLAAAITTILQYHAQIDALKVDLAAQTKNLRLQKALQEHAHEGVIVLDADLRIIEMNPTAETMMGYRGAEVFGQMVQDVLIGAEVLLQALEQAQTSKTGSQLEDIHLYRRNGDAFLVLLRIFPVQYLDSIEHVLILLQDLSEQEQIRLQTQQLEQRALLGEVTAVFAHEVRNPIHSISTGLQYIAGSVPENDIIQDSIARMLQDCDRLAELMKSVLAFAKPEEYVMSPVDITSLLKQLLERNQPRLIKANVNSSLQVEANCPAVLGNLRALERVFSNLMGNALQAMADRGGHLIIKARPVSVDRRISVEISVTDTGPGISREDQDRVFQPFFTTEKGGTGLGLAIVKRIVTAHKGSIGLTSFPGGTIFRVRLPAE